MEGVREEVGYRNAPLAQICLEEVHYRINCLASTKQQFYITSPPQRARFFWRKIINLVLAFISHYLKRRLKHFFWKESNKRVLTSNGFRAGEIMD